MERQASGGERDRQNEFIRSYRPTPKATT
jgi:hypothetical protein